MTAYLRTLTATLAVLTFIVAVVNTRAPVSGKEAVVAIYADLTSVAKTSTAPRTATPAHATPHTGAAHTHATRHAPTSKHPADPPAADRCADNREIVAALCKQIDSHASGYQPAIVKNLSDWFDAAVQIQVLPRRDNTYDIISRDPSSGEKYRDIDDVTADQVQKWTPADVEGLLPNIRVGSGPAFQTVAARSDILMVAAFRSAPGAISTDYSPLLVELLGHRGIRAQSVPNNVTADDLIGKNSDCQTGQMYFLYETTEQHRDRSAIGLGRDNAYVHGFLYDCSGSIKSPAVYGQDQAKYAKGSDKTSLIGFLTLAIPHWAWKSITPAAALALTMVNTSDSSDVLAQDSVERAMQQMVDSLCQLNTLTCNNCPISRAQQQSNVSAPNATTSPDTTRSPDPQTGQDCYLTRRQSAPATSAPHGK